MVPKTHGKRKKVAVSNDRAIGPIENFSLDGPKLDQGVGLRKTPIPKDRVSIVGSTENLDNKITRKPSVYVVS